MSAITYLIPISIGLALLTFLGVLWTVRAGQYDDPEGNAERMLDAEDVPLSDQQKNALRQDQT